MRANERESSHTVVERGRIPSRRRVARRAIRHRKRRSRRRVRRIICLLPRRQVAPRIPAVRRVDAQRIIPVDVALAALNGRVFVR